MYLLLHALASRDPWDVTLAGGVWARLLGLEARPPIASSWLSRQWAWLEQQRLVTTKRAGRHRQVTLRREDGSGRPYTHPGLAAGKKPPEGNYLRLPYSYWRGGFDQRLHLSGKLILLIALSLQDDFILPVEHAARWYGISVDRVHQGLRELRALALLDMRTVRRSAPLTERGFTYERHYTLRPPFRLDDLESMPADVAAAE
jgi:hypothetical protein